MSRKHYGVLWQLLLVASFVGFNCEDPEHNHPGSQDDYVNINDRKKMTKMASELLIDAYIKMRQITEVRIQHEKYVGFHVGVLIGRLREKYRLMEELFIDINAKHNKKHGRITGPGIRHIRLLHYTIALQMITHIAREIEHIVHTLEVTATDEMQNYKELKKLDSYQKKKKKPSNAPPLPPALRMNEEYSDSSNDGDDVKEEWRKIYKEEQEKSLLRQQFLLKKLGLPANGTTTKKRFFGNWPVEDTWNLDKMY